MSQQDDAAVVSWVPKSTSFQAYDPLNSPRATLRVAVSPKIAARLTQHIIATYQRCNPAFTYSEEFNPKRYLTNPSTGVSNNGLDNKNSDLILAVNGVIINSLTNHRYIVKEMLGQGTFGQVVKCWSVNGDNYVAVKVIKNQIAYFQQARVEVDIVHTLNSKFDPDDTHHIVRILDSFMFEKHLCIAFELLSHNLYELIKFNSYKGLSLQLVRRFTKQILDSLSVLRDAGIIHCDLKPENILLSTAYRMAQIKLIDFGSACYEHRTVYSYIQSRFYRSPEVLLGHPYTTAIDMWSLGCVAAELFVGLPLFPGDSEYDVFRRIIETLGCQPPDHLLRKSSNTNKYFKTISAAPPSDGVSLYQFLTASEFKARENKEPLIGKTYLQYTKLEDIIIEYPLKSSLTKEEINAERKNRRIFVDFLRGLVRFDPKSRWTPRQASQHPFITEVPFSGPFEPLPETPRTPVRHAVTVEHNPGAGHWCGAGLSPMVGSVNYGPHYGSPHYQGPYSHASSYGSYGSYGSCDGFGVNGSYGSSSYSDGYFNYPTPPGGPYMEARWRMPPTGVPAGYGQLGISPSNSVLKPMSLGASPSFTPPGSHFPSPSSSSPRRYGPPSPAYGKGYKPRRGFLPPVNQSTGFSVPYDFDGHNTHAESVRHSAHVESVRHSVHVDSARYGAHVESVRHSSHVESVHSSLHGQSHLRPASYQPSKSTRTLASVLLTTDSPEVSSEPSSSAHPDCADWFPNDSTDLLEEESHYNKQTGFNMGAAAYVEASSSGMPVLFEDQFAGSSRLASQHHHQRQQQSQRSVHPPGYSRSYIGTGFPTGYRQQQLTTDQIERHLAGLVL